MGVGLVPSKVRHHIATRGGRVERIAITGEGQEDGVEVSHLAVRYDAPPGPQGTAAGLCLLYLHGFGSDQWGEKAEHFRARALAAGFAFCSLDFQGHGRSGGTMQGLTLSRNLADVARVHAWLRERGIVGETGENGRLVLVGSSMGGGTALWYSALHPEEVAAGLHIAPALDLERSLLAWAGPERARTWQETGAILFENDLVSCELSWELIEDLRRHPMEELLASYRTPALLLQGKKDTSVPWKTVADFAVHVPYEEVELHLIADGDHRLTDRKDRLWDLMLEFLRGRGLTAAWG
jgi:pimeloyl-ACP methyl ester carboxylesterase